MALADTILLMGSGFNKNIRESLTKADISGSLTEVTQLELSLTDYRWAMLSSGLFALGMRVQLAEFNLEIANITTGADNGVENVTLKCRPIIVRALKNRRGARVMRNVSPSDFVASECAAVGAGRIVQPSARRSQVARDVPAKGQQETDTPPSSWTTFQRLARELGYVVFESAGTIFFGKPSWIIGVGTLPTVEANYIVGSQASSAAFSVPECSRSFDDPAVTASVRLLVNSASQVRAGKRLVLSGVPTFSGSYIISSFNVDLLSVVNIADIQAATPLNPTPQPPS